MALSFLFKKIMDNISEIFVKVGLDQFFKNLIKIPIEKIHHQKLEKNLKFMKNKIFTSLERPLLYLYFDIIFMVLSCLFKKIMDNISEIFVKVGLDQFFKNLIKIPIEKIHHQKLEKNLKFMKNKIFTSLERSLLYLYFDIIFMVLSFLFKKIMDNISEIFVKVGLDQFFKN
jgi:hypothetical protein